MPWDGGGQRHKEEGQRPRERQIREKGPEGKMRLGVGRSRHRGEETEA